MKYKKNFTWFLYKGIIQEKIKELEKTIIEKITRNDLIKEIKIKT